MIIEETEKNFEWMMAELNRVECLKRRWKVVQSKLKCFLRFFALNL